MPACFGTAGVYVLAVPGGPGVLCCAEKMMLYQAYLLVRTGTGTAKLWLLFVRSAFPIHLPRVVGFCLDDDGYRTML
jgi:hypothetical protein